MRELETDQALEISALQEKLELLEESNAKVSQLWIQFADLLKSGDAASEKVAASAEGAADALASETNTRPGKCKAAQKKRKRMNDQSTDAQMHLRVLRPQRIKATRSHWLGT